MDQGQEKILRRLAGNTIALSTNQVVRIGISTVISLLVARQLGAEGFGKYTILVAYGQVFQVLAVTGVPRLIIREMARNGDKTGGLFWQTMFNQILGAAGSALLLLLISNILSHPPDTKQAVVIVALTLFPFAVSSAAESVFQAREQMGPLAWSQILGGLVQLIGSVAVLYAGYGILALAWMIFVGQSVATVIEIGLMRGMGFRREFRVDLRGAVDLWRQSFDFYLMSLSVVLFSRLDVLILSQMANEKAVGVYNAAYLIIRVINFLSVSYSNAAYPTLSRLFHTARARFETLLSKSLVLGTAATLLVAILLAVAAQPLIGLLYQGEEYDLSVLLLRIETPFVVIFMWNALLSNGLMAGDLQRRSVIVSGVKLGAALIYYLALIAWWGSIGAAIATVLAGLTGTGLNYYFLKKELMAVDTGNFVIKPLAIGSIVLGVIWLLRGMAWPGLVVAAGLSYILLLLLFRIFSPEDFRVLRQSVWPS